VPGPRIYTVDEVNRLLPQLDERFAELDGLRERTRAAKIRLNALEMIWGEQLQKKDNPDHAEYLHYLEEMKNLEEDFRKKVETFTEIGATVKGVDPALVDFYGVRDGVLVYLCWKRGEKRCGFWHHIDAGFSGREKI
jgi:hypothetical protein